ncbi:TPA: hypothetical protein LOC100174923 [Bos taurus]|uniref:Uncharacterized protein n=2 Tax=Bos TaxID=9903 RepID=A0A4W2ELT8_BOBOX|nr:hypothetical LOC100174923 protein [Bos taurus]DAA32055.1 TPA: hypothetical protein LOC100174923 [Bos taurus]
MMAEESFRILKKSLTQGSSNRVKRVPHDTRLGLRVRHSAARQRRANYNSHHSARRAAPIVRHNCEGRGPYKPLPVSQASFYPAVARRSSCLSWVLCLQWSTPILRHTRPQPGCHGRRTCRGCL